MNSPLKKLVCLCLTAGSLLALGDTSQALAQSFDFSFRQGPAAMVIPVNDYRQFHSHLTNTGEMADSYTLTATAEDPANWTFNVCYDGVCYPPDQGVFTVPNQGTLEPGASIDFDFDVEYEINGTTATGSATGSLYVEYSNGTGYASTPEEISCP